MSRTLLTSKLNKQISARRTELRQTVGRGAHMNCTHVRVYSQQLFIGGLESMVSQSRKYRFCIIILVFTLFSCLENILLEIFN